MQFSEQIILFDKMGKNLIDVESLFGLGKCVFLFRSLNIMLIITAEQSWPKYVRKGTTEYPLCSS